MKMLDDYFNLRNQIFKYFGYVEDWCVFPIVDHRFYYWSEDGDIVKYADSEEQFHDESGNYYESAVYKQRFLKQWVYRAEDLTMILIDTQTDGNKFLAIFQNNREIKK